MIQNIQYILNIRSNVSDSVILFNGENRGYAPNSILVSLSDLQTIGGSASIVLEKNGYVSNTEYLLTLIENPTFNSVVPSSQTISGIGDSVDVVFNTNRVPVDDTIKFGNNPDIFSNTPQYILFVTKLIGGQPDTSFIDNTSDILKELNFELFEETPKTLIPSTVNETEFIENDENLTETLRISLSGINGSAKVVIDNQREIEINNTPQVYEFNIGSKIDIVSSDLSKFRITNINVRGIGINSSNTASTSTESLRQSFVLEIPTAVVITTEEIFTPQMELPSISFVKPNEDRVLNINSNTDYPIGIFKNNTIDSLRVVVGDSVIEYANLGNDEYFVILIPFKYFPSIGNYQINIIPRNNNGDGTPIQTSIRVISDVWVGEPDIRNIVYPSIIEGADFVGTDVDFTIGWDSINTDFIRLYRDGSTSFLQLPAIGKQILNVRDILTMGGNPLSEDVNEIDILLNLIPYNISGKEEIVGKSETISIKFLKGSLEIPKSTAVNRIAEGFINQFSQELLEYETSKYLTHTLHLGDGDNKVITTWTGSVGSLILKLYEPLPTSVQPNQQVWISKYQSNPLIETVTLSGTDGDFCSPLKGPNFSLEPDNGIGFKIYDELIASGSETSVDLVNRYLGSIGIDTSLLNIQYTNDTDYLFENFVNFGSAEERVNNFFYKVKLIEKYKNQLNSLTDELIEGTILTNEFEILLNDGDDIFSFDIEKFVFRNPTEGIEAGKIFNLLNNLLRSFDGFEKFLFNSINPTNLVYPKTEGIKPVLGYPIFILKNTTDPIVISWYNFLVNRAREFDKNNPNYIINNIPEFVSSDSNNADFLLFFDMIGNHFDNIWVYINTLNNMKSVDEGGISGVPKQFVSNILKSLGWDVKKAYESQFLWEYVLGQNKDGSPKYSTSLEDANNQVWRRILNNLPYLLKHKGTARSLKAVMSIYGVPQSMLTIMEFGGPTDPTKGGVSEFTFDDRTASLRLQSGSSVILPWKDIPTYGYKPQSIELMIKPDVVDDYNIIRIDNGFEISLIQTTGSFVTLNFKSLDVESSPYIVPDYFEIQYVDGPNLQTSTSEFPLSTQYYSNILINKTELIAGARYDFYLKTSNGEDIIVDVKASIISETKIWETGSFVSIGNNFNGNIDELRIWRVPLEETKMEIHTLFPDSIAGNSITASTSDLIFRLDFEYPKDRVLDPYIKNVAITGIYEESFATASNFYTAEDYPYQYEPYERTVTARVPSLGFNYSNKIRFEDQELVDELSYKKRATKKSFDTSPVDSSRLGLFFSPIKELNMDIIKSLGDFNIDNYIGNPSDEYEDDYKELNALREYYFERFDLNMYEYIRLIKYINKSLFDVLSDLAPARAKVSKGLLIEPHFLERSKVRWNKPQSERNDFDTDIDANLDLVIESEYKVLNGVLDIDDETELVGTTPFFDSVLNIEDETELVGTTPFYDGVINDVENITIDGTYPTYHTAISFSLGERLLGEVESIGQFEQIGMNENSLSNLGFGLYAEDTTTVWKRFDIFGNVTQSRNDVYLVEREVTKNVRTQVAGWPTLGSVPGQQVVYEDVPTVFKETVISIVPFSQTISLGNGITNVTPLKGYFPTHYRYVNGLGEGLQRSFFKGSVQTQTTTPDGLPPVETFTTNPNILRVANTGRGSGEPILIVE